MPLKLMYITDRADVATIAQKNGVDIIFIDMEYIGKEERQSGLDSVKLHHTVDDVKNIRRILDKSKLLVRINPIHDKTEEYGSSEDEIEAVIAAGADILMLPMAKSILETERFVKAVGGRAKTMLLVETAEAAENIEEILDAGGIDEVHIGLNDLHLAMGKTFMFELLTDGTVEKLCKTLKDRGVPYGFGGIARIGYGMLPAERVIAEHYRLGSERAILSRSFCDIHKTNETEKIDELFMTEIKNIRDFEVGLEKYTEKDFEENRKAVCLSVSEIVSAIKSKENEIKIRENGEKDERQTSTDKK